MNAERLVGGEGRENIETSLDLVSDDDNFSLPV